MNRIFLSFVLCFFASSASASTGFWSQFSHFSGGFLSVILVAYIILRFINKYRDKAIIYATAFSIAYGVIDQAQQFIRHGKFWGQAYDFAAHTFGAVLAFYLLGLIMKTRRERSSCDTDSENGLLK